MNHIYKTIWNKAKNMFVVASEVASGQGKTSSEKNTVVQENNTVRIFSASMTALASMLYLQSTHTSAETIATGSTLVHNANNGVQIIDIATANKAGISHNRYINYNVDKTGQILNNAVMDAKNLSVMTSLAGKIHTNANLKESARLILNEVTGTQRSILNGYIEVAGQKANVVIANPYGITCTGCGFINTDYSVLTTGKPNIGLDGKLNSFDVRKGDITINGLGLDASQQPLLKLISRNLYLDGQINAQNLSIVTGSNQYNFETDEVKLLHSESIDENYAIDSTQLGGIYANKISLLATEQGVGVRMAGDAAANTDEFVLTSAGAIELTSKISSKKDIEIQNLKENKNSLNIQGSLTAQNVNVGTADNKSLDVNLQNANLFAENNVSLNTNSIDSANTIVQANGKIDIDVNQNINLYTSTIQANNNVSLQANTLSTTAKTSLRSKKELNLNTNKDLTVGDEASLIAENTIKIQNATHNITVGKAQLLSNQEISIDSKAGDVVIEKADIQTAENLNIHAQSINFNATVVSNNTTLTADNNVVAKQDSNMTATELMNIQAKNINLLGGIIANNIVLNAGEIYSSENNSKTLAQESVELTAKNAEINGVLGANNLSLNVYDNLSQTGDAFAKNLFILEATNAQLYGKNSATNMNLKIAEQLDQKINSIISVADNLTISANKYQNNGNTVSNNIIAALRDNFTQNGYLGAINNITATSKDAVFNGQTEANDINISVANKFTNTGTLIADTLLTIGAQEVLLDGSKDTLVIAETISVKANDIEQKNGSLIQATDKVDFNATNNLALSGKTQAKAAQINALNKVDLKDTSNLTINNLLDIDAKNMNLAGNILANNVDFFADAAIKATGQIQAINTLVLKADSANLAGDLFANTATMIIGKNIDQDGGIYVTENLAIDAQNISQKGLIFSKNTDFKAIETLTQNESAQLVSDQNITLHAKNTDLKGVIAAQTLKVLNTNHLLLNGQTKINGLTTLTADKILLDGLLITGSAIINGVEKIEQTNADILISIGNVELDSKQLDLAGQTFGSNTKLIGTNGILTRGLIQADGDITIKSNQDIQLSETSKTIAKGHILLDTQTNIHADGNETTKSAISSNADISITANKQANLSGEVLGKNITVTSHDELNTGEFSSLKAQDKLSLKSKNQSLNLSGISYGNQQNINAKSNINVNKSANVQSLLGINIEADTLTNHGVIRNAGTTNFELINLFNTGSLLSHTYSQLFHPTSAIKLTQLQNSGLFLSNKNLALDIDLLSNDGDLISNGGLQIKTNVFENTAKGQLSAVKNVSLDIDEDTTVNQGLIGSGQSLFIDAKNLVNKNTIQAQNIELEVNQLTNEKDMLAKQGILVNSRSDVTNQGEIYADESIKIVSQNSVINQNMIYTGTGNDAVIKIESNTLNNTKQQIGNTTGVISSNSLDIKANAIVNDAKIIAAQANISAKDGNSQSKLTNNKQATFALLDNQSGKVSNLNTNVTNNTDATFFLDGSGTVFVTGHLDNNGLIYAGTSSDLHLQSLNNNLAKVVLDNSKLQVVNDYSHTGMLEANNKSKLMFSSLHNISNLILDNSALNVSGLLTNNSIINSTGQSSITANTLSNNELIFGSDLNGHLSIDADQLNLNELSGLISQGELSLNTKKSNKNTIQNLGNIFAKGDLSIGTSVTNFSNLMSKNKKLTEEANTAYGGVISSDSNINFNVNNFTNNYHISNTNGDIEINVNGNFSNETVYYGEKLSLGYVWKVPTFIMTAPNRDERDTRYYDSKNVKYKQVSNAGAGDGVDAVLVTENWYLSTIYNGNLDYNILSPYLNVNNNIAQIRANSGDIIVNLNNQNTTAKNYGAKIVADQNIKINATGIDFKNETIDVFEDKLYELEYLLMSDKDNRHRLAYRKDATNNATLVRKDIDDDDYERTNNYLDVLDSSKINFIVWDSANDVQTKVRNILKTNGFDLTPFKKTEESSDVKETQAIISAGSFLSIKANGLSNSSNTTKAFVGSEKKTDSVTDGAYTGAKEETCDASKCPSGTSVKPTENVDALGNKLLDLPQTGGELGNVDTNVSLEDVKDVKTDDVITSEKSNSAETVINPLVTKPSTPRVVNNDYPMDKIPKVNINLPNALDKYGQYVTAKNPNAEFLIESNPLYGQAADVLGSNYLREQLGIEPDLTVKRLGDSRYEQELVRQQIEQITNKGTISDNKMQQYFDNAVEVSKDLGFIYGQPLTASQIKQLDKDIVWMVEKVVNGQRVLVPQVYLSYETLQNIDDSGSVLEGEKGVHLDVDSLDNNEATIKGGTVIIDAKKDINNIGATIKGRDVQLTSKEGSINNITQAFNYGDSHSGSTYIGPTAGIVSENSLVLDAAKDINITGAKVKAGGDAIFEAGNDINITTIQDKRASTTRSGNTTTNISSTTHIGSEIDIGGSAYLKSGNDTVISGSQFNTGANFVADTGGDFKLVSVQDTVETNTKSSKSGFGVGGGLFGSETTETNEFVGKNKASTLNVGGVVDILSKNKVVIEGSDIKVTSTGMSNIHGSKGVDILDGKDEHSKETTVTTTTFFKLDNNSSAKAEANADANHTTLSAQAGAGASAEASSQTNLKLMEKTVEKTSEKGTTSVSSNINTLGGISITSDQGDVRVRGSNVEAKGALVVEGVNVFVEASKNEKTITSNKDSTSFGLYREDSASASANAGAAASIGSANAQAGVQAEISTTTTLGAMSESSESYSHEMTNNLSSLKGGTITVTAQETARFEGADVRAQGKIRIDATDIENIAVKDTLESKSSSSSNLTGLYVGATAGASAGASVNALLPVASAGASAEAKVSAELSGGLRSNSQVSNSSESKVTHTGNTFVSESGDVERVATNAITDEMTSITASNGVIRQSAKTVTDRAVYDVNEKTSSSSERETRVGVYAGVEAGASTEAGTNTIGIQGKKTEVSKPDASAGFQASHSSTTESSTNKITTAKTSSFTAQNIESDVSGHMELEGTSFTATNRVTLNAGSLTFNEAVDKVENTQNNSNLDIGGKVGVVGTPSAEVNFGIGASASDDSSQQGRGGEIKANSFVVNVTGQMETTGLNIDVNEKTTNVGTVKTNNLTNEKNSNNSSVGFNLELSNEGMNMDVNKDGYNSNVKIKDYN